MYVADVGQKGSYASPPPKSTGVVRF